MTDERSVVPSPGRLARARRAGLRPRTARLAPALGLVVLAVWIDADHPELRAVATEVEASLCTPTIDALARLGALGLELAALLVGLGLACAWIAAAVTGEIGVVERARDLDDVRWRRSSLALGAIAIGGAAWIFVSSRGVVAGAARAVDASEDALVLLWRGWAVELALVLAATMIAASFVDLWLERRAIFRALHLTLARAREERRERGGRRG